MVNLFARTVTAAAYPDTYVMSAVQLAWRDKSWTPESEVSVFLTAGVSYYSHKWECFAYFKWLLNNKIVLIHKLPIFRHHS